VWLVVVMPLKPLANSLRLGSTWKTAAGPSNKSRFCRVAQFREVHFQSVDAGSQIVLDRPEAALKCLGSPSLANKPRTSSRGSRMLPFGSSAAARSRASMASGESRPAHGSAPAIGEAMGTPLRVTAVTHCVTAGRKRPFLRANRSVRKAGVTD
jgi:hypothetical protein